ncbi:MAG: hypothetical protein C0507_01810 [Cyanobacteria bacterium PR.3.49]|nr:hypothetical protein [Cyanobacteria bacterium PR.3.49]
MKNYTAILCFLLFLFCLRVVGQILVAFFHVDFLPPMDQWYSGLLPYPILLICQFLIVGIFAKICFDLCRKSGYFARKKPRLGAFLVTFSYFYYSAMVIRYIYHMSIHPTDRWFGGTIPIIFHFVLATFLILFGRLQRQNLLP